MKVHRRIWAGALLAGCLAGCSSPAKQEQLQASQNALLNEAMALQRCAAANGYSSQRCAAQRKIYEDHLASFKATYGR
jgi:hypothetical protein